VLTLATPFVVDEIGKYIKEGASVQPNRNETRWVVIHHAAAFYSPGTACASIFKAHCERKDFGNYNRIGYHEVVQQERDDTLRVHLVNPPLMWGAGVFGRNDLCYHICAATNFTAIPDDAYIEALAQRAAVALRVWPHAQIVGHKEITLPNHGTTCPGQLWALWKPRLLKRVSELLAPPVRRFRALGVPIYQAQNLVGTLAGHLKSGEEFAIDKTYSNGGAHLADGRGFIDLSHDALEELL